MGIYSKKGRNYLLTRLLRKTIADLNENKDCTWVQSFSRLSTTHKENILIDIIKDQSRYAKELMLQGRNVRIPYWGVFKIKPIRKYAIDITDIVVHDLGYNSIKEMSKSDRELCIIAVAELVANEINKTRLEKKNNNLHSETPIIRTFSIVNKKI